MLSDQVQTSTVDVEESPRRAIASPRFAKLQQHWPRTRELHLLDLFQAFDQRPQLALPHGALFANAIAALGQDVELLVLRQELYVHTFSCRLPGQSKQCFFQFREAPLGRADEIGDWRIGLAHLGQHFLGWDAAIHHPDALRFAVLCLDFLQEYTQRRAVGGVPREYFVGQRKALWSND